jgi:ATP-binding cassette subfamily B protein
MRKIFSLRAFWAELLIIQLWRHMGLRRRRQFLLLFGLMLLSAFAEVVSLGAVLPFLGILTSPEQVYAYPGVAQIAFSFGLDSAEQLLLPITVVFALAAVVAGALRIALLWISTRLAFGCGADLSSHISDVLHLVIISILNSQWSLWTLSIK